MKKIFVILAAVAAISACSRDDNPVAGDGSKVTLSLDVRPFGTKAYVTEGADLALDKVQVLVFDGQGRLEADTGLVSSGSSLQLSVNPGPKTIWAVGNIQYAIDVETLDEMDYEEHALSDNSPTRLLMTKCQTETIKQSGTVSIALERMTCKIVLEKIVRNFSEAAYDELPLTVKRVYLSNVSDLCNLAAEAVVPSNFCVQKGVIGNLFSLSKALIVDEGLNDVLYDADSHDTVHTFYAYPNGTTQDTFGGNGFSARRTRLVVECEYNGSTCYYPITLPGLNQDSSRGVLERNKVYTITNLTLTRPGSPDPDVPGDQVSSIQTCTFDITVQPWVNGQTYTETFS